jgi:hypothetical protein
MKLKVGDKIKIIGTGNKHSWHSGDVTTGSVLIVEKINDYVSCYNCRDLKTNKMCDVLDTHEFLLVVNGITKSKIENSKLLAWLRKS